MFVEYFSEVWIFFNELRKNATFTIWEYVIICPCPLKGWEITGAPSHGGLLAGYLLSRRPFGGPKWDATASKADSVAVKPNSREMWATPAADHVLYSFRRKTVQISAYLTCKRSRRCLTTCTMLWIRFAVNIECMRCSSKLAKWEKYIYIKCLYYEKELWTKL